MSLALDPDALYVALIGRNPAYEGFVFVGVTTTGVFCRLSCPARKPKRENVRFYDSSRAAQDAGFRPCLRCRPLDRRPTSPALQVLSEKVRAEPEKRWTSADLAAMGYDPSTVRRAFQREYGVTFARFARQLRLGQGVARLRDGASVVDAQLDAGYESGSGFREAVNKLIGEAPSRSKGRGGLAARWLDTPIGAMIAIADPIGLHLLEFSERKALPGELTRLQRRLGAIAFGQSPVLDTLERELAAYFAGVSSDFSVPIVQQGAPFAAAVWDALRAIPVGQTRSYGALAVAIGRPEAARAAARANGANQVAILVPCHRVLGADGDLVGYGGKLWRKRWLLEHERRLAARFGDLHALAV